MWEHYEAWPSYWNFKHFIEKQFPLADILHRSWWTVYVHAEQKAEEHGKIHSKLMRFRDSLAPQLQPCVDPFLIQQDKLRVAYRSIYMNIILLQTF